MSTSDSDFSVLSTSWPVAVQSSRLLLRTASVDEAVSVRDYFERNSDHLSRWASPPPLGMAEGGLGWWEQSIQAMNDDYAAGKSLRFFVRLRSAPDQIMGIRSFTRIRRGQDCSCTMSGSIDHRHLRRGFMTEAGRAGIRFMFEEMDIHRIDAEYDEDNPGSPGVLQKLGFVRVGLSPRHRFVNGQWRNHVINALINPDPIADPAHVLLR